MAQKQKKKQTGWTKIIGRVEKRKSENGWKNAEVYQHFGIGSV
jgi:hypothetical protein